MIVTREMIAAVQHGLGHTNRSLSALTRERCAAGLGPFVSAEAISGFLKAGYPGTDIKGSLRDTLIEALVAEGGRFVAQDTVFVPKGALAAGRGRKTSK